MTSKTARSKKSPQGSTNKSSPEPHHRDDTVKFNGQFLKAVLEARGLHRSQVYRTPTNTSPLRDRYPISKSKFEAILRSGTASRMYAGRLTGLLGVRNPQWFLHPKVEFKKSMLGPDPTRELPFKTPPPEIPAAAPIKAGSAATEGNLDLIRPSLLSMATKGERLIGRWRLYYYTYGRLHDSPSVLFKWLEVEIDIEGRFKAYAPMPESESSATAKNGRHASPPKPPLVHSGVLFFENKQRLLIISDEVDGQEDERCICRFSLSGLFDEESDGSRLLPGAWLGVDRLSRMGASFALLASPGVEPDRAAGKLAKLEPVWFDGRPRRAQSGLAEAAPKWSPEIIRTEFERTKVGESIDLFSTYLPNFPLFESFFEGLVKRLAAGPEAGPRVKIRVLLLHYNCDEVIRSRFELIERKKKKFKFDSIDDFKAAIISQARNFHALGRSEEISKYLDVQVFLYRHFPFGQYFRIGNRLACFGVLWPGTTVIDGPMLTSNDPASETWQYLAGSVDLICQNNRPLTDEEVENLGMLAAKKAGHGDTDPAASTTSPKTATPVSPTSPLAPQPGEVAPQATPDTTGRSPSP